MLEELEFDAQTLMATHPPVWRSPNKLVAFEIASPAGADHEGRLHYSRWAAAEPPDVCNPTAATRLLEGRDDVYDYRQALPGAVEWHVNFADPYLFVAYGTGLFAQDEMQVVEHPILGALKEALEAGGHDARTVEGRHPTPILIMGAERRCAVSTEPNAAMGRPAGLYGNRFAAAPKEVVRQAVRPIVPATVTNLLAIAAPSGGYGEYEEHEIGGILRTAYTGFSAARQLAGARVAIHTGFWGCGAFGGNRRLMAMLQLVAAQMAEIDLLVFHAFDAAGMRELAGATETLASRFGDGEMPTSDFIAATRDLGFRWGTSDGN